MLKNERSQMMVELVRCLNQKGSWTGSTHIQKSAFFLQHLLSVPLEYKFVIYHYGPFSFDLDSELALLLARRWLEVEPVAGYGVHYRPGQEAPQGRKQGDYSRELNTVVDLFGSLKVKQLELLATTYYVVEGLDGRKRDLDTAFEEIHRLKPHFTKKEIENGYEQLKEKIEAAQQVKVHPW